MPTTAPGFFIGWRLESGCRYRGVLLIHDYEQAREGNLSLRNVRSVPEKEVIWPAVTTFPYAEATKLALESMRPPPGLEGISPDPVLSLIHI